MNFPTNGLVFYAPLWHPELSGSPFNAWNIADGGVHACTVSGATWGQTGRTFAGAGYISVPDAVSLRVTASATVIQWVYPTVSGTSYIDGKTSQWATYTLADGANISLNFRVRIGETNPTTATIAGIVLNSWYHVASKWEFPGNTSIFINGVVQHSLATAAAPTTSTNVLYIGASSTVPENPFTGKIGGEFIYNRALSTGEILHNYNCTKWRYQ